MNSKTCLRKIRHNYSSLLLTALPPFFVPCSWHVDHITSLYYFSLLLLNSPPWLNTVTGPGDKKGFVSMKGFTTPPGSMPPWLMARKDPGLGRIACTVISLTGHSFERSRGQGIVEKLTSDKKDSATYLSIWRQLSSPRVSKPQPWDYSCGMFTPGRLLSWPWYWYCIYRGCLLSLQQGKIKR